MQLFAAGYAKRSTIARGTTKGLFGSSAREQVYLMGHVSNMVRIEWRV